MAHNRRQTFALRGGQRRRARVRGYDCLSDVEEGIFSPIMLGPAPVPSMIPAHASLMVAVYHVVRDGAATAIHVDGRLVAAVDGVYRILLIVSSALL